MARRSPEGSFTVSGPYEDEHAVPSPRAGLCVGETFCTRNRHVEGELTYYVRDLAGGLVGVVTKHEGGTITAQLTAAGEKVGR